MKPILWRIESRSIKLAIYLSRNNYTVGGAVFPNWIHWHLGNWLTCYFSVCRDKRPCYKRCRMQSLDQVEIKIASMWGLHVITSVSLPWGLLNCPQGEEQADPDVHQSTHLLFQLTAHRNSTFSFLTDATHKCSHSSPFLG